MTHIKLAWAKFKGLVGRTVCRLTKGHRWTGEGPPVQHKGHRTGYAPAVCARCGVRSTFRLSPSQLVEAKRAYRLASKIRLVR